MIINKFEDKELSENYINIYYKEMSQEVAGILDYLDYYNTLVGENEQGQKLININEILYCEIVDRKCYVYLENEVYQTNFTIQKLLDMFQTNGLVRISKSMAVNILKIDYLKTDLNMRVNIQLDNGEIVVLNRGYKKEFYEYLKQFRREC